MLSFYSSTARLLDHALRWLQALITVNQVYDIFIATAAEAEAVHVLNESTYLQQDQQSLETLDLEVVHVLNESTYTQDLEALHDLNESTYLQQEQQSLKTQDLEAQQVL